MLRIAISVISILLLVLVIGYGLQHEERFQKDTPSTLAGTILTGKVTMSHGQTLYGYPTLDSPLYNLFSSPTAFCSLPFKNANADKAFKDNVSGHYTYRKTAPMEATIWFTLETPQQYNGLKLRVLLTFTHAMGGTFTSQYFDKNNQPEQATQEGNFQLSMNTDNKTCP
ncbi:hypothetical protein [uncultured Shewanella sp.]|uniref:hypothetical protein n=1 Tax=uncultured Shewanella sp. TaxID=173975 RepID=UPI002612FB8D|nr:hypothetical protein [uncultured Shewanella sp.]